MSLKETFFYEDTKMYIEIDCYIFIYKWIYPLDVLLSAFGLEIHWIRISRNQTFSGLKVRSLTAFKFPL